MKRRMKKQLPKIATMGCALVFCVAGTGYLLWESMGKITADSYGCFSHVYAPQTIVLVDASEPRWNETQARALHTYFENLYQQLGFNERLSVFTTEGDQISSVPAPRFHICGQARNANELSDIGAPDASEGYLRKQKQRLFKNVFKPQLDALLAFLPDESRRQTSQSPILEFIRSVSRLTKPEQGDSLVVISDAIQNSESLKFCRVKDDMPTFNKIKQRRIYQERLKPETLSGVNVSFLMLMRGGYGQQGLEYCYSEEELRGVWRDYFIDNGVSTPEFIRIR
ncbi:hypothetical protein [Aliikangiella maris]|uniref:Uncharacterized protein n=2 Tax=Aliikangiella maris TaxID=3162458 RepID=A0ABV3MSP3_9GAMM